MFVSSFVYILSVCISGAQIMIIFILKSGPTHKRNIIYSDNFPVILLIYGYGVIISIIRYIWTVQEGGCFSV